MNKPKLTMIELFAGYGSQIQGFKDSDLFECETIATSETDKDVSLSYAAIHHNLTDEMVDNYKDYPSREQMVADLIDKKIGMDFDENKMFDWNKLAKKKTNELEKFWLANKLQNNYGDISSIKELPYCDMLTYSFCCQDISVAGKQKGLNSVCEDCGTEFNPMDLPIEERDICPNCGSTNLKGTRSGLLKEVERLITVAKKNDTLPKYLLLENVKNLVGKQFKPSFDKWLEKLDELGYNSYWTILNGKECGVPQNRQRTFVVSIRKDIDTCTFEFPKPFDNGIRLKDILETNVDEKYYINTDRASNLIKQLVDKGQLKGQRECCNSTINDPNTRDISIARYDAGIQNHKQIGLAVAEPQPILVKNQGTEYVKDLDNSVTLKARDWKGWDNYGSTAIVEQTEAKANRIGGLWDGDTKHQAGSIWNTEGVAPTLDTAQGGGRQPHIIEEDIKPIWKELKGTQYKVSNTGIVADTKNKCKVEPFVDDNKLVKIKLNINNSEKTIELSKLVNKLFPNESKFIIGSTQKNAFVGNGNISPALTSAMGMGGGHVPMIGFEESSKPICVGNTTSSGKSQCNAVYSTEGVSQTLCAGTHGYATGNILEETNKINVVGNYMPSNHDASRVVSTDGVAPTVKENHGTVTAIVDETSQNYNSDNSNVIGIKQATKKGYIECELPGVADFSFPNSQKRRGRVQGNGQIVPTLTAAEGGIRYIESIYRIRKLTPKECGRLMGLKDEQINKMINIGMSNSALYKQFGNSIITNCIELIAEHLYKAQYDYTYECTDEKIINFQNPQA